MSTSGSELSYEVGESHVSKVLDALDNVRIGTHGLVDIAGVGGVLGETLLRGALLPLVDDLLADTNILFHQIDAENS